MAAPLKAPDPLAWRVSPRLADHDRPRLDADGLYADAGPGPVDLTADLTRPLAPTVVLELVRAAGGTHLVPLYSDRALCGARVAGPWVAGRELNCTTCTTILPPEA